ncbi:MAG: hypothetical protein KDD36_00550 [Flavobacteriales bacterium]|nr:hypothetical protein [Flavobacteriales bacterium]
MKRNLLLFLSIVLIIATSCNKEKEYVYEVNDVVINPPGSLKDHVKSTIEFISIAYSDLFGTTISNDELVDLAVSYAAVGDKKLVEDMIIRNFLNKTGAQIPTKVEMENDVDGFINDAFRKFYNRDATDYEKWYLGNLINQDNTITPELVYYGMMTSNEYRYY